MSVMFLLIIASLIFAIGFLAAFLWAVRSGQFDDRYTPAVRMLFDDGQPTGESGKKGHDIDKSDNLNQNRLDSSPQ